MDCYGCTWAACSLPNSAACYFNGDGTWARSGQDLGNIVEDVDPLWEEQEDSVKSLEEKFVLLQNQLTLVESREVENSKVTLEKLDQFENSLLALGKKVVRGVDAKVTGDEITSITKEIKDLN